MIKCEQTNKLICCSNCERLMPFGISYTIDDGRLSYNGFTLCEDCSNALSNLHCRVMEQGIPHKYDKDEISVVGGDDKVVLQAIDGKVVYPVKEE